MLATRVAVLRGGPSSEYDVSMNTGAGVLTALRTLGYHTSDIIISKSGEWMVEGRVKSPAQALLTTDVAFIALHGTYGEDGTIQQIFERHHIPFTGSNSFPSRVAFDKDTTKRTLQSKGITLPRHIKINHDAVNDINTIAHLAHQAFGQDYVLKPTTSGSSHGMIMAKGESELKNALVEMLDQGDDFMIEERIRGVEATVAILEDFRDETLYVLPPIEIIPPDSHDYFAADVKYTGATQEICPGRFSFSEKRKLAEAALLVHTTLGLTQYSRSDFMIRKGEVYFLEVNTLPGLTSQSLYPKAAEAVGLPFTDLIGHLIKTARVF